MTAFWTKTRYWELALYFYVFTKQIIGKGLTKRRGWPGIYHGGLEQAKEEIEKPKVEAVGKLERGSGDICVLHTDSKNVGSRFLRCRKRRRILHVGTASQHPDPHSD